MSFVNIEIPSVSGLRHMDENFWKLHGRSYLSFKSEWIVIYDNGSVQSFSSPNDIVRNAPNKQ
jgi:hypothetical protein